MLFKKSLKYSLLTCLLFVFSFAQSNAQMIQPGEFLEYEVSFMGINLGKIKLFTEENQQLGDKNCYKVKASMKSSDGIPFVKLDATFESWLDQSVTYSHKFSSNMLDKDDKWEYSQIVLDYTKNILDFKIWKDKKITMQKQVPTMRKWNDGSSLLFTARKLLNIKKTVKIPTLINNDTMMTIINFHGKKENIEIDAVKYPIKSVYFDGRADWEGIYGLKGNFEGWFSDDEAAVPILAKMNVYVGKVQIKLVNWKRAGWSPPKGS